MGMNIPEKETSRLREWQQWEGHGREGQGEGRKEGRKQKRERRRGRRGGEKEEETETGGWTVCTLGRVKCTQMNVEL